MAKREVHVHAALYVVVEVDEETGKAQLAESPDGWAVRFGIEEEAGWSQGYDCWTPGESQWEAGTEEIYNAANEGFARIERLLTQRKVVEPRSRPITRSYTRVDPTEAQRNDVLTTAAGDNFMVRDRKRDGTLVLAAGRTDEGFDYTPQPDDTVMRFTAQDALSG